MKLNKLIIFIVLMALFSACKSAQYKKTVRSVDIKQITIKDSQFIKDGKPYYFVGANYWYGPLIGAKNGGDRERLIKELDLMKSASFLLSTKPPSKSTAGAAVSLIIAK